MSRRPDRGSGALCAVIVACGRALWRHARVCRRGHTARAGLPGAEVIGLPGRVPYAYPLPGGRRDWVLVTMGSLVRLGPLRALSPTSGPSWPRGRGGGRAGRQPSAGGRRDRQGGARLPWRSGRGAGRFRDVGLLATPTQAPGSVSRRVAALLAPAPGVRRRSSLFTSVGPAVSAMSSVESASAMVPIPYAMTPL